MKSDLYWQVMPKPKSRQNPVSFLITCREKDLRVYTQKYISPTHFNTSVFLWIEHLAAGEGNISEACSDVAQQ